MTISTRQKTRVESHYLRYRRPKLLSEGSSLALASAMPTAIALRTRSTPARSTRTRFGPRAFQEAANCCPLGLVTYFSDCCLVMESPIHVIPLPRNSRQHPVVSRSITTGTVSRTVETTVRRSTTQTSWIRT